MTIKSARVLSVMQPWADLIVSGHKIVENRTWATPYRGPLLIHASKRPERVSLIEDIEEEAEAYELDRLSISLVARAAYLPDRLGFIVGVVNLVGCDSMTTFAEFESPGAMHWRLADPYWLAAPIPIKGQLGIWTTDIETDDEEFARRLRQKAAVAA